MSKKMKMIPVSSSEELDIEKLNRRLHWMHCIEIIDWVRDKGK